MKKIIIIAGDKSGDIYGGLLCQALKAKQPSFKLYSCGGENLAKHSHQLINLVAHSTGGLIEVLASLKKILAIFKSTLEEIDKIKPDLIILIDFPDFNLRLAKTLNKKYPIFYYVSPQIWAWRKSRINLIKKYVEKMVVIFKFEQDFYLNHGVKALYFGHPLLEVIPPISVETKNIISFMPGSRKNEIKYHLPIMQKVKELLAKELKDYSFHVIRPENIPLEYYTQFSSDLEIINHSYEGIKESKFILTSSGTATVEIAILNVPFIIIYRMNPLTWALLKALVKTKFIGMVNILAKRMIVEELLQNQANPEDIAKKILYYLKDSSAYKNIKNNLEEIKTIITPYSATKNFANYISEYLIPGTHT